MCWAVCCYLSKIGLDWDLPWSEGWLCLCVPKRKLHFEKTSRRATKSSEAQIEIMEGGLLSRYKWPSPSPDSAGIVLAVILKKDKIVKKCLESGEMKWVEGGGVPGGTWRHRMMGTRMSSKGTESGTDTAGQQPTLFNKRPLIRSCSWEGRNHTLLFSDYLAAWALVKCVHVSLLLFNRDIWV